jgi:hypothetical protein
MPFGFGRRVFLPCLSVGGMLLLSYVLGAAVVHFQLPTSAYLHDAFIGGEAWFEQKKEVSTKPAPINLPISKGADKPDRTFEGFTLYTTNVGAQAFLLNMDGEVIHEWEAPFSRVWPKPPHVPAPVEDAKIYFFACHLYPNGDLLAVYHGTGDTPYGYGLAKLDKDSNVLWTYSANAHHAVDVGEDGTIYVLTQRMVHEMPKGLEFYRTPALVDYLVLLSPQGKELKTIPLLEALRDSPFALLLTSRRAGQELAWDILHTNSAEVLRSSQVGHYPLFKAGQILLSLRELDALAMVDPERRCVVWAARGPWRGQHDPHFLDNGRLLIFDNAGSSKESRVLEYDPQTQACPWFYSSENSMSFISPIQGRSQRLRNGNTLIVNSKDGVLLEVTPQKELVWSCDCHTHIPWAMRYGPDELTFLKGTHHARAKRMSRASYRSFPFLPDTES